MTREQQDILNQQMQLEGQHGVVSSMRAATWGAPGISATSMGGSGAFYYSIYVQLKDMDGNDRTDDGLVEFWLADSEFGALTAYPPIALNVVTGKIIENTQSYVKAITSGGLLELNITNGGSTTWFPVAAINGLVTVGPQVQ